MQLSLTLNRQIVLWVTTLLSYLCVSPVYTQALTISQSKNSGGKQILPQLLASAQWERCELDLNALNNLDTWNRHNL